MIDHAKVRREALRWYLLLTLYNAEPVGCYEQINLDAATRSTGQRGKESRNDWP